jgi:hypothetical protein
MKAARNPIQQTGRSLMNGPKWRGTVVTVVATAMLAASLTTPVLAQSPAPRGITLYEDVKTGALYRKPGRGRVAVTLGFEEPAAPSPAVQQQVQQLKQSNEELRAEFNANQQSLVAENAALKQRVDKIEPAWTDYLDNFRNRFRVGALVYTSYKMYTHTGFGPQQYDNNSWPGPGNNLYNTFDVDRAYLNFYFNPTPDFLLRVTPDIYKTFGTATPTSNSHNSSVSSNLTGDDSYRLKYAYIEYNKLLDWAGDATKGTVIQFGSIPNAFIPWEEDLNTFRYVTDDAPWNYLGLSSAQFGVGINGPIKYNELTYVDYGLGVYTNAKYSQLEQSNTKQGMGRLTVYPFGSRWRFQGLGLTGFYDYGYNNTAPDNGSLNTGYGPNPNAFGHVANAHLTRWAALLHYTAEEWGMAFEYDQGHNSFPGANLFSGNGPTVFFTPPATATSAGGTTSPYGVPYYNFSAMTAALLGNSRTVQQGFDVMGHLHIPETPFRLIGLFQWFEPNSKVNNDPLDFYRYMVGVEWQINEFVRLAVDTQNLQFYHDQTPFSTSYANSFAKVFLPVPNTGKTGPKTFAPPATVAQPVPRDTHAVELNLEFAF